MEVLDDFACPEPIVIQPIPRFFDSQLDEKADLGVSLDEAETCTGNTAETSDSVTLGPAYALQIKGTVPFSQSYIF